MSSLLIFLLFLVGGACLGAIFLQDNGYVLVAWQQTSVEMSLVLAVLLLVMGIMVIVAALELVLGIFGIRLLLRKWLAQRRHQHAQLHLNKGMAFLALDDYRHAEKCFVKSAELATNNIAAYLAASQAAHKQQAIQRAEEYLARAETPANRLTVQLARVRLWMATGQWEAAASSLKIMYSHDKKQVVIAELWLEALLKLQSWSDVLTVLPALTKTLSVTDSHPLLKEAYQHSLHWLAQTGNRVDKISTLKRLRDFWATLPSYAQRDPDIIHSYAQAVITIGFEEEAEELVRVTLSQQWHNGLVELYGRIRSSQPERSLQIAQDWLQKRPQSPMLLLTLGRLSLQNRQWSAAKAYFEQSLTLHKNTETYAEFVRLLQHLEDPEANHYFIAGLNQLVNQPLPNLPLP